MRSIVLCSVLSMMLLPEAALAAELETGSRCELAKNLKVSAKAKGKGKKTTLKKGAVLEVVELGKPWSEVTSEEGSGFVKTKKLTKVCTAMEAAVEEAPADDSEGGDDVDATAEEAPAEESTDAVEGAAGAAGAEEEVAAAEGAVEGAVDETADGTNTEVAGDASGADASTSDAMAEPNPEGAGDGAVLETPPVEAEEDKSGPEDMLEFGIGLMAPIGIGDVTGYGVGAMLELRYNITENFAAGLRVEGDVLFSGSVKGSSGSVGLSVTSAYLLEGEAQLWDSGFSPVGGLAVGLYSVGGASADAGGGGVEAGTLFGLAPKVGIDLGGFRIAALYHLMFGKTEVIGAASVSRNFLAVELSGQIGFL